MSNTKIKKLGCAKRSKGGRPVKYATEEEHKAAIRESQRRATKKRNEKVRNDPVLNAKKNEYGRKYYRRTHISLNQYNPEFLAVFKARIAAVEKEQAEIIEDIKELCSDYTKIKKALEEIRFMVMKMKQEAK